MPSPGDVVLVDFPGADAAKNRPAVVLSTPVYHAHRPDLIVGLLTTQLARATAPTDYLLLDWAAAGLKRATAFRSYILTLDAKFPRPAIVIGHLSDRDWAAVQDRVRLALAL
jgi:mRNA interferase MazF